MALGFDPSAPGLSMVFVCCALAMLAAYVAIDLTRRVRAVRTHIGVRWLAGAAAILGTGLWSVHIISVGARTLPFALGHEPLRALGVWLLFSVVAFFGFGWVSSRVMTLPRVVAGAVALGLGIAVGQWVALLSLGLRPGIDWTPQPMLAALGLLVGGALVALVLAYRARARPRRQLAAWQSLAALALGLAVVLSEQFAIDAAGLPTQIYSLHENRIPSAMLVLLASVGSGALLLVALLLSILESRLRTSLRRAEGELQRQSFRDPLTKLPNRLMFESTLTQAVQVADQDEAKLALFFIDLDGFKPVNESLGHHGGDRLLRAVASRLKANAKDEDFVAHLGGDEFVMLVRGSVRKEGVANLAARLLVAVNQPCRFGGREAAVSASIGIAMYPEQGPMSALIAHAEAAMRAAKGAGGATFCFFEPRMVNGAREQVELLRDLRGALAHGQLELYYQPKVHAPSGEITGAEALLRWHHPQRGLIAPSVFIPIAERFGLINAMGNWVIDEACRQARAWRDQGLLMRVAINLSVYQLRNPDLIERICAALGQHQVNPRLLTCEITESVAMDDADGAMLMFEKLASAGVHLSIDDFGTGYSSLSYLRKLRAGELKIDRSFVLDLETSSDARAVVDAVIKLAQALGIKVVAEGVETEEQHHILRSLGCDELQGFLFAKPMPANELALWAIDDVGPRALDFRDSLYQPTSPGALH
jgi:diguanylate cyclase (GGDEF)-like protein